MLTFVEKNIDQDDITGFFKPRALSLFTNRKSVGVTGRSHCDVINDLYKNNVKYFIVDEKNDPIEWFEFEKSDPENFKLVYKNSGFKVFLVLFQGKCIFY